MQNLLPPNFLSNLASSSTSSLATLAPIGFLIGGVLLGSFIVVTIINTIGGSDSYFDYEI